MLATPPGTTTELWPPLGLLYIAASVRSRRDDEIVVIDAFCENLTENELVSRIVKEEPDMVGLNCSTHTFLDAIATLSEVKEKLPDTVLAMGGYHATFAAEHILREYPCVDFIIKGEAEHAFVSLLECIERGEKPSMVEGISFLDSGKYMSNPLTLIQNLDALPFPARDLAHAVEYGYFHEEIPLTFGKFTTINTSRGCPFNCTYCSCAAFSARTWRRRSAENVVDELEELYKEGFEQCVVVDDNFTFDRKRVEKICRLIRERGIHMQLYCEGRVHNASYSLMKTMKRAGFNVMYFGAESASPHVLKYYNKTITPEQTKRAVENAKKAGMIVITSFIFGAPVESADDILRTIRFIEQIRPHAIQINILDCLLGTPIWDELVESGVVADGDWKRNHRIYEYPVSGFSREELERYVNQGYETYITSWKNAGGLKDLARLMIANKTARKIVMGNLFNPHVRERLSKKMRIYEEK